MLSLAMLVHSLHSLGNTTLTSSISANSLVTFQYLVKLQELSVSFNLACHSQQFFLNTTRNLWHMEHVGPLAQLVVSPKDARAHYLWFHQRMPVGNKEHLQLALYHFDIDVHLQESLQQDKILSFLISMFCTLADSVLIPSTTQ